MNHWMIIFPMFTKVWSFYLHSLRCQLLPYASAQTYCLHGDRQQLVHTKISLHQEQSAPLLHLFYLSVLVDPLHHAHD